MLDQKLRSTGRDDGHSHFGLMKDVADNVFGLASDDAQGLLEVLDTSGVKRVEEPEAENTVACLEGSDFFNPDWGKYGSRP